MIEENIPDKKSLDGEVERNEEVQAIIDRMPTKGGIWVVIITGLLIGIIILLGFVIKYPDTVDGQIAITARHAPVRLVANSTGKVYLLKSNLDQVEEGEVVAYIESGVNYKDVLEIDSLLRVYDIYALQKLSVSPTLTLGELSSSFTAFLMAHLQYFRFMESDIYRMQTMNLQQQIEINGKIVRNMSTEELLKEKILHIGTERTEKDSVLAATKTISEEQYQRQYMELLSQKDSYQAFRNEKLSRQSQLHQNKLELRRMELEKQENEDKLLSELLARKNELTNAVRIWKEKYLLYAPVSGELEFLGFWRENEYVQSGHELFSIIPSKNRMMGEVLIPAYGVGKVKVGQTANVKVENYPYDEFGMMQGSVQSISRLSHKMQAENGKNVNAYRVIITFPNGLKTNFGKELALDFESVGNVEIITKPKRLIERLFDNLKAKTEK